MAIDYDRLKRVREEHHLSVRDMAAALGMPTRTYFSYEAGERDVSTATLLMICEKFGVSADELLGITDVVAKKSIATINGRLVYMIPIYELSSVNFDDDFVDYMPEFFHNMDQAKSTIAINIIGESMFPKLEHGDILIVRRFDNYHSGDILLINHNGTNLIRRVTENKGEYQLEAINPTYPPISFTDDIKVIGIGAKIIKKL